MTDKVVTVLLVEDDSTIRNLYAFALNREGFRVTTAESGVGALGIARETQFDVMVLDMMMMGGSGLDFLRAYDVKRLAPGTLVVGLSNLDSAEIVAKARLLGVDEYLNKSQYDPIQLSNMIKLLLAQRAATHS